MEEKTLSLELEAEIKGKAKELMDDRKVAMVYPIVVWGRPERNEKEFYVAYLAEPNLNDFDKFLVASKRSELTSMRRLAKDCFLDGDRELVDVDSLFMFGLMSQLSEIISTRQTALINL